MQVEKNEKRNKLIEKRNKRIEKRNKRIEKRNKRIENLNRIARERESLRLIGELSAEEVEALSIDGVNGLTEKVVKSHNSGLFFPFVPDRRVMMRDYHIKRPADAKNKYRVYSNSDLSDEEMERVRKKVRESVRRGRDKGKVEGEKSGDDFGELLAGPSPSETKKQEPKKEKGE